MCTLYPSHYLFFWDTKQIIFTHSQLLILLFLYLKYLNSKNLIPSYFPSLGSDITSARSLFLMTKILLFCSQLPVFPYSTSFFSGNNHTKFFAYLSRLFSWEQELTFFPVTQLRIYGITHLPLLGELESESNMLQHAHRLRKNLSVVKRYKNG